MGVMQMLLDEFQRWEQEGTLPPNDDESTSYLKKLKSMLGQEDYLSAESLVTQYAACCEQHAFLSGFCRALTLCMEVAAYPW